MTSPHERELKKMLEEKEYLAVRAAGSLGIADLVAIKPPRGSAFGEIPGRTILIEQKTVSDSVYNHSGKSILQWKQGIALAAKGHEVVWAVRFGRSPGYPNPEWRFWHIDAAETQSRVLRRDNGGMTFAEAFG